MARVKNDDHLYDRPDDFKHSRLRPEILFGSREPHTQVLPSFRGGKLELISYTWVPALWTMFREIIDNSLDEMVKHGQGDTLKVEFDPTSLRMVVEDNGRGLPIREIPKLGKGPAASILLGSARSGRNFEDQRDGAGMNGVGGSAVNFTSEYFDIVVERDGAHDTDGAKHLSQRWEEAKGKDGIVHKTKGPHVIRGSKKRSGTRIEFRPSEAVYTNRILPLEFVRDRCWDIAVINPKIKVFLNGERLEPAQGKDPIIATYFSDKKASVAEVVQDQFKTKFYVVPGFTTDQELSFALVNNIPVFAGGPHVEMFRTLYTGTVIEELKRRTKKEELNFTRDMVAQGSLVYAVTFMHEPRFDSQSKTRLTSTVAGKVRDGYIESDMLSMIRRNPEWVEEVIERARLKTNANTDKEIKKEQRKLKNARIVRLDDASHRKREDCILFVMEGDSAKGLLSNEREDYHGILPMKGKVMNARQKTAMDVIKDKSLADLMGALGLAIGTPAIRRRLRYGAVYIAADEDEDGKNITALLVNFFYQYWPELFRDEPFVYRFCTPYLILTKGKETKYIYASDYEEFQKNPEAYKGWHVIRAKGLATLNAGAWKHVLKEPCLIPLMEDDKLKETLSLIFDADRVDDRKNWLEGNK